MTLHREGRGTIAVAILILVLINLVSFRLLTALPWLCYLILILSIIMLILVVSFFRIPSRKYTLDDTAVIAPCDGKVVVIEEVQADEYFKDKRLQVSIFMSPLNVHVNRNPVSGEVLYDQYHKGKYLVAWHPKSSTDNERHTNVYRAANGKEVLTKQIAGAAARRIVNYLNPGDQVRQAGEMGFIKFGSRVDLLLPLDAQVQVKIGDIAVGGVTVIAKW